MHIKSLWNYIYDKNSDLGRNCKRDTLLHHEKSKYTQAFHQTEMGVTLLQELGIKCQNAKYEGINSSINWALRFE